MSIVWIISFEFSGIASLGGLGEAVKSKALVLAKRGFNVTVLMPAHGRCYMYKDINFRECSFRIGLDGLHYRYCIGACEVYVDNVRLVLFRGLDDYTSSILDSWHIYSNTPEKASLLARAVRGYIRWSNTLPDIIDVNDWHSVLAGVAIKQEGELRGYAIPLVYTIHLSGSPSFPWHYASSEWSGLGDYIHPVWRVYKHNFESYKSVWDSVYGNIEAFGVHEADVVATVSWSYLREELARRHGDWITGKSCVTYNTTDVRVEHVDSWINKEFGGIWEGLEWRLIEEKLRGLEGWGYIEPNGILVVSLGRLTWQKGFDIAIKALDHAPEVKLLILGIPVGDIDYENYIKNLVYEKWSRVKVITGKIDPIIRLALMRLSKTTIIPSRWEPFGMTAVESIALGTPVVASNTGGLKEIVVDLRWSNKGTGILVKPEDHVDLGLAMRSLAIIMTGKDYHNIPLEEIRRIAYTIKPDSIRENCIRRVEETFREEPIYKMIINCYNKARQMAHYRAVTI
ncbi:MAG: glycogen/starch synthase [Acidilobaceae archaeon]